MRLTPDQKLAVLAARTRPGQEKAELVRVGDRWACVWFEPEQRPAARYRGQLLKTVQMPSKDEIELCNAQPAVWWAGAEVVGKTRRATIQQLQAEALL